MRRRAVLASVAATMLLAACRDEAGRPVDPRDYRAFFLWPGVAAPEWLSRAGEVYLLAGEVRHQANSRFVPLRAVPRVSGPKLWMVVRVERLDWNDAVIRDVLHTLARWQAAGNHMAGLQIDFDAATRGLDRYAGFLQRLRARLPARYKLSVTGLLDWSRAGDPRDLRRIAGIVDEIVVQTYQGRRTIPGHERYLASLRRLPLPYRVALVEGGTWRAPPDLATDPRFRGYVVFLLGG